MEISLYDLIMLAIYLLPVVIAIWQAIRASDYRRVSDVLIQTIEGAPPTISEVMKNKVALESKARGQADLVHKVVQKAVKEITPTEVVTK
ncbi:hypothetical protein IT570_03535 [Candidatus Sumerlaeota bacterium]|nr:hypothetical protein [Candidatus Sumerlaeota bacterium]